MNLHSKKQKLWIDNYENCGCNVDKTAQVIGVTRRTFNRWMQEDKEFNEKIVELDKINTLKISQMSQMSEQSEHHINNKEKKSAFLEKYPELECHVKNTCKAIGIGRTTYYDWINNDERFAQDVINERQGMLDDMESLLMKKAKGFEYSIMREKPTKDGVTQYKSVMYFPPCFNSIISILNAQARERGYAMKNDESDADNNSDD